MDEPTAISYSTVTLRGKVYVVKFGQTAIYRLKKQYGITVQQLMTMLAPVEGKSSLPIDMVFDVLSACLGGGFMPEQLTELISTADAGAAVFDAVGKASLALAEVNLREPASTSDPLTQ